MSRMLTCHLSLRVIRQRIMVSVMLRCAVGLPPRTGNEQSTVSQSVQDGDSAREFVVD
jgi:hypothetical protein